ncbi:MAG: colanic acid biosynthesis glycosyltransferase WcaL, partial [Merismopedia sp. SIO2A8]|nr:colanic acid biosynthesis glycosyltransferase WcaL [Merismopedia sp. SIO2A8]
MNIAYFVNQYPKVSHSFIRREILGLEAEGLSVQRFAIRACEDQLVDPNDQQELEKTKLLLSGGVLGLAWNLLWVAIAHPIAWFQAFIASNSLGIASDRGVLMH